MAEALITGLLSPLYHYKTKKRKIVAFDTEDDSQGNVSIVNFFDGKKHVTIDLETCTDKEAAIKVFYEWPEPAIFVAHNLEYDVVNIFRDSNYIYVDEMVYTSRLMRCTLKKLDHILWDSFNWWPTSLKKIGEKLGMRKGNYLEARDDKESNIKYCQMDCEILWTFVNNLQNLSVDVLGVNLSPTIGKMAMEAWRSRFTKRSYGQFSFKYSLDAYYGGRTEVFWKGRCEGDIKVADFRSMYPTVMKFEMYPDTSTIQEGKLEDHKYGIGRFKVFQPDVHIPALPFRASGRLFFPVGEMEGWWSYAEIRHAQETCGLQVIEQYEGFGTNIGCRPFVKYVDYFYNKRKDSRACGDKFGEDFYKLFLNNLYGKYGQHNQSLKLTTDPTASDTKDMKLIKLLGPFKVFRGTSEEPAPTSNFMWGIYITAYARIRLHKALKACHDCGHDVLYCDTDSVFYRKNNDSIPFELGTELGQMEEQDYVSGNFVTAKGYELVKADGAIKYACKGVPTDQRMEFLDNGFAKFRKPTRLRESLTREITANVWNEVEKHARQNYKKRKYIKDGNTLPHNTKSIPV